MKQHGPVRRLVTWASWLVLGSATAIGADQADRPKPDRPNIVWISLEDITPMLGCYGDQYARTPVFDELAGGGFNHGSYVAYDQRHNTEFSNLLLTVLQRQGIESESFGKSTHALNW